MLAYGSGGLTHVIINGLYEMPIQDMRNHLFLTISQSRCQKFPYHSICMQFVLQPRPISNVTIFFFLFFSYVCQLCKYVLRYRPSPPLNSRNLAIPSFLDSSSCLLACSARYNPSLDAIRGSWMSTRPTLAGDKALPPDPRARYYIVPGVGQQDGRQSAQRRTIFPLRDPQTQTAGKDYPLRISNVRLFDISSLYLHHDLTTSGLDIYGQSQDCLYHLSSRGSDLTYIVHGSPT